MIHEITVNLRNLSTGYISGRDTRIITSGINASLHAGELTCLLGQNGAGKSTLLKTLSSFIPAVKGDIELFGMPLGSYSNSHKA